MRLGCALVHYYPIGKKKGKPMCERCDLYHQVRLLAASGHFLGVRKAIEKSNIGTPSEQDHVIQEWFAVYMGWSYSIYPRHYFPRYPRPNGECDNNPLDHDNEG